MIFILDEINIKQLFVVRASPLTSDRSKLNEKIRVEIEIERQRSST
jgi:hypothetical protein